MHERCTVNARPTTAPRPVIQKALRVGASNDPLEREADAAAARVVSGGECGCSLFASRPRLSQRSETTTDADVAPAEVSEALGSSGQELDFGARTFFEGRFGHDFSRIRVHTDAAAGQSALALGARAYTYGDDIVFASGQYAPRSPAGRHLIAHELAHTIQQGAGGDAVQRKTPPTATAEEDVWGLRDTQSMCRCKTRVEKYVKSSEALSAQYAKCDTPANPGAGEVEACVNAAFPSATVMGSTSSGGIITMPPPSTDPCEKIENKMVFVHETMHDRYYDKVARKQGKTFFEDWKKLKGDKDRVDKLRPAYSSEVDAFETEVYDGHEWAQDEVHSYKWDRRFSKDVLKALDRIC